PRHGVRAARLPRLRAPGAGEGKGACPGGALLPGHLGRVAELPGPAERGRAARQLPRQDLRKAVMEVIRDLLQRDRTQRIEEIVKVDQADEQSVHGEITEYIATDRIRDQYRDILKAIAEAPAEPHEGIGVWISGFFGSGKSSFAKNLGYVLDNRTILDHKSADLFKLQVQDEEITWLIDYITLKIPTKVVMFDVSVDAAVNVGAERMAEIMFRALLRELDYAEDYTILELEMELEKEGKLEEFMRRCQEHYQSPWRMVRKGAQRTNRASAILHSMDPTTYPNADSCEQ